MTSASVGGPRPVRSVSASSGRNSPTVSSRTVLVGSGILAALLAVLVIGQALRTYSVTLDRFQSIAENSTAKVDAAEAALQNVADMDANAAVFVATAADNPIHWKSQQNIHDRFQTFREQMFIVRSRLDYSQDTTDPETAAYNKIEYFSFDQFWQHLGNLLTAQQNADNATAPSQRPKSNLPQLAVTSSSVDAKGFLSIDCTCDGASESPAVEWKAAPVGTKSFAISLWHTAPDQEKSYWVIYNIPANVTKIPKNSKTLGKLGLNDRRRAEYDPMCSKGPGVKTYHVTVFALSAEPQLPPDKANRVGLLEAIKDITLAEGTLDFQYERKK